MDFELTPAQRRVREEIREFAARSIIPFARTWDRARIFPRDVFRELGARGYMGLPVPRQWGGTGEDYLAYAVLLEELSRADAGVGVTVAVHTSVGTLPLLAWGTDEQKAALVPPLARGEVLGAFSVTEPRAGSDMAAVVTRAQPEEQGYRLDGAKRFVTNGGHAGSIILVARTADEGPAKRALSAFVLEPPLPGLEITGEYAKLGIRSSSTVGLRLRGVSVPAERRLGSEGQGLVIALQALDGGRVGIAAQALGIAQAAYDLALAYAKQRQQFGGSLSRLQAIQWKLADMGVALEAARLLTYRAAWLAAADRPFGPEAAMAKLHASETARSLTNEAVQILGGVGYLEEYGAERLYRDAKVTEIYEGTSEIQRLVIARALLEREPE